MSLRLLALVAIAAASGVARAEPDAPEPPSAPALYDDLVPTGPSVEERLAEIAQRVQAEATYPPLARARGVSGETLLELRISPEGLPEDVRTRKSSGSLTLDRAAERAVHAAAPLPPIFGTVLVPVRFQLSADE